MKKMILIMVLAMVAMVANAQSVSGIIGQAKKQHIDCDHVAVVDGYLHDTPCGGAFVGGRMSYAMYSYENEYGTYSTNGFSYGLEAGYKFIVARQLAVKPTVYAQSSTELEFEGQKVRPFELGVELPFEFCLHHKKEVDGYSIDMPNIISFEVAPCLSYCNIKSIKELETKDYDLTIPAQSNVWFVGVKAAVNFRVGKPHTIKKVQANGRIYKVYKHHPVIATVGAKGQKGTFHKPAGGQMDLNPVEIFASLKVQL